MTEGHSGLKDGQNVFLAQKASCRVPSRTPEQRHLSFPPLLVACVGFVGKREALAFQSSLGQKSGAEAAPPLRKACSVHRRAFLNGK